MDRCHILVILRDWLYQRWMRFSHASVYHGVYVFVRQHPSRLGADWRMWRVRCYRDVHLWWARRFGARSYWLEAWELVIPVYVLVRRQYRQKWGRNLLTNRLARWHYRHIWGCNLLSTRRCSLKLRETELRCFWSMVDRGENTRRKVIDRIRGSSHSIVFAVALTCRRAANRFGLSFVVPGWWSFVFRQT